MADQTSTKPEATSTTRTVEIALESCPRRLSVPTPPGGAGAVRSDARNDRAFSVSTIKSEASEGLLSPNSSSPAGLKHVKSEHHEGIYWKSPITMVLFFLLGIGASISHHFYYLSLDGDQVGNDREQQWALRWGTTFAYITQVALVSSAGFAYTQWLFRTLKRKDVAIEGLDAAFGAESTIISLFHKEMLMKIKVGSILALVIWCLPLPSLVTPATLFVLPNTHVTWQNAPVSSLDMYSEDQYKLFTYSVQSNTSNGGQTEQFLGPRTIISRLSTATATQGEILSIQPPFVNATYSLEFFGPAVQCSEPNSTIATYIRDLRLLSVQSFKGNLIEDANYYFAFVPDLTNYGNSTGPDDGVMPLPQVRLQEPTTASNQLWMAYSQYVLDPNGQRYSEDHYSVCQLYNASYNINLTFVEGNQTIQDMGTRILNSIDYPQPNAPYSNDLMIQHTYSAIMWALSDLLVGSMGLFTEETSSTSNGPSNFSEITSQIEHTSLLGSSDLDAFFDANHYLSSNVTSLSPQRIQDINLARNRTLDVLISELCYNTTLSFMTSNLLSPSITTNVTLTVSVNTYAYHSENLLISYSLAIFFALLSNILGAAAYWSNGVSHNKSFSAILTATRDKGLTELFHAQALGRLPLPEDLRNTRLRFGPMAGGGFGFTRVPGDVPRRQSRVRLGSLGF